MKVLFVIPENKSMFGDGKSPPPHPHVGVAYLIAVLKKNNIKTAVFDEGIEEKKEAVYKLIEEYQPDVIGITGFSYAYGFLEDTIKRIKRRSKVPLIVGGPHISATNQEMLKSTKVDFAFKGEGEVAFLKFLKELKKKNPDFNKVPGLIWKKGKKIIENTKPAFIKELDKLPFPDYQAFKLEKYPCYPERSLPILTSRGCPFNCNYCSVRLSMGRSFRPRSPANVVAEMRYWYKKGFKSFDINDDCFTLDLARAEKICDLLIKAKLKVKLQLYNGIRVDRITLRLLKKLKKAGCIFIAYGCEAGNEETLRRIKKNISLDQVRKAVDWTNKAGINNAVNFIIGHQEETYEQALDSLRFAKSLPSNFVNFYNLVPYPGTEVYDWAMKKAKFLVNKKTFLKEISYRDNTPIFETKKFTKKQREEVMKKGFALYEKKILRFRLGPILGPIVYVFTRIKLFSPKNRLKMKKLFSYFYHSPFFKKIFPTLVFCLQKELIDCQTVLDIGCGPNSPLQYCENIKHSVGVEPFAPYLKKTKKRRIHSKYLSSQAQDLSFPPNSFDAVILIEVLEHLSAEAGLRIIKKAERWARKKVVVSCPNGFMAQEEVDQNPYQKHLSGWKVSKLRDLGFQVRGLAGLKALRREIGEKEQQEGWLESIKYQPRIFWLLVAIFSQVFVYFSPRIAYGLFAVKELD